jgi:hypothetical protein
MNKQLKKNLSFDSISPIYKIKDVADVDSSISKMKVNRTFLRKEETKFAKKCCENNEKLVADNYVNKSNQLHPSYTWKLESKIFYFLL